MTMRNGRRFATGNHPVEMLVPVLHLTKAGFTIDVCTPTGRPVQVEQWAQPREDEAVQNIYRQFLPRFEKPLDLRELVQNSLTDDSPYLAVFIPGGHGAMLGLPENEDVGRLLRWVQENDRFLLAICHGPAALLAADQHGDSPFRGYSIAAFPDLMDKITPWLGYLAGKMPWFFNEKLEARGIRSVNRLANGT